jgi:hypothetical protein
MFREQLSAPKEDDEVEVQTTRPQLSILFHSENTAYNIDTTACARVSTRVCPYEYSHFSFPTTLHVECQTRLLHISYGTFDGLCDNAANTSLSTSVFHRQ